jgi:hypothetical protein
MKQQQRKLSLRSTPTTAPALPSPPTLYSKKIKEKVEKLRYACERQLSYNTIDETHFLEG